MAKNVITMKVFLRSLILKLLVDFKASKSSAIFSATVLLKEVILAFVDLKMGVHFRLREVFTYRRLK